MESLFTDVTEETNTTQRTTLSGLTLASLAVTFTLAPCALFAQATTEPADPEPEQPPIRRDAQGPVLRLSLV